jgi:hypothetical protein
MTKTDTRDVQATLLEIWSLEAAGCDIVRCAVPVREAAEKLGEIKRQIRIPLVADIHFNYKLASSRSSRASTACGSTRQHRRQAVRAWKWSTSRRTEDPDPHRRQRRLAREGSAREVQRPHRAGHGGVRAPAHPHPRGLRYRR